MKCKEKRVTGASNPSATSASVGPGSYDSYLSTSPELYKLKPSPGFASKSVRSMDNRKGHLSTLFTKQRLNQRNENMHGTMDGGDDEGDGEYEDDDYIEVSSKGSMILT